MKLSSAKRKLTNWSKNWWDRQDEELDRGRGIGFEFGSSMGEYFRSRVDKREFVTPTLDRWDKSDISSFNKTVLDKLIAENGDIADQLERAANTIPKYYQYNLHNMYLNPPDIRKIENVSEENRWQMRLLENMDNYYMKGITYDSKVNSTIFTSELMGQMILRAAKRGDNVEDMMKNMSGNGGGAGNAGIDQSDEKELKSMMEEAEKRAEDMISDIKDASDLGLDGAPEESGDGSGKSASKQSGQMTVQNAQQILEMKRMLQITNMPKEGIMNFVKEVIKKGSSYFSSQFTKQEEEFLESESDDILNLEELNPAFRLINLEDIVSEERQYHMKFDIYVDISGSMHSQIRIYNPQGKNQDGSIKAITLAKVCGLKMFQMGLVNELNMFNTSVKRLKRRKKEFIRIGVSGGTDIDTVIRHVDAIGNPAIIITDAGDYVHEYSDKVYFLTLAGGSLDRGTGSRFYTNKQVAAFEGGKFSIPRNGKEHRALIARY